MERLSRLRVSPEWECALIACLDVPPKRPRSRLFLILGCALLLLVFAGIAGIAVWLRLRA
jgi:hypothetical protein